MPAYEDSKLAGVIRKEVYEMAWDTYLCRASGASLKSPVGRGKVETLVNMWR